MWAIMMIGDEAGKDEAFHHPMNMALGYNAGEHVKPTATCDKKTRNGRCGRNAYQEVYWSHGNNNGFRHWSYLCRYHYYLDRIKNFIFRWQNWYCDLDENKK